MYTAERFYKEYVKLVPVAKSNIIIFYYIVCTFLVNIRKNTHHFLYHFLDYQKLRCVMHILKW